MAHLLDTPVPIVPHPGIGQMLAELLVEGAATVLVHTLALTDAEGRQVSGLANSGSEDQLAEPFFDLTGVPISANPHGLRRQLPANDRHQAAARPWL